MSRRPAGDFLLCDFQLSKSLEARSRRQTDGHPHGQSPSRRFQDCHFAIYGRRPSQTVDRLPQRILKAIACKKYHRVLFTPLPCKNNSI